MKAYIITIGDELLLGQVIDTNSSWLGKQLANIGIAVYEKIAVQDDDDIIVRQLAKACEMSDLVLVTGGLGPTKDDITKLALAKFLKKSLVFHEEVYSSIKQYFIRIGKDVPETIRHQCYMPEGVQLLENKMGTAPGMRFEFDNTTIISMPGVPYEMKYIMEHWVLPVLQNKTNRFIYYRTICTYGLGESKISEMISHIESNLPSHIKLAYLPNLGGVRLRLSGSSLREEADKLKNEIYDILTSITDLMDNWIYGFDDDRLVDAFIKSMNDKSKTLALAESCSGGYVSHLITKEPGVSSFYIGSVISYDNRIKENVLKVKRSTLVQYGAVSEECVREMLKGVLTLYGADIGASISGIAGPTGGTEEKPVGTIWVAYGSKDEIITKKLQLGKDRKLNIEYTGNAVLNMLRKFLLR